MHLFKVWAPKAESVAVKVDGAQHPLEKGKGGWWSAPVKSAGPGSLYTFLLDGKDQELPDPRSQYQPQGVNGPSCVVDHSAFPWKDQAFHAKYFPTGIIYELHVGTFTPEGTCDAAIEKLDYLRELGVTHIELLPFAEFPGKHGWGYDGVDLFAPHAAYGGPDGLKRLVDAAHARNLAVLMDVVYNHFGPSGNYVGSFGPYFTDTHKTPWGDAVNLEDGGSFEVRRFFCDNALMWLRDYHMDGLRLDAVHAYMDRSAINFMEQINREVHALQVETGRPYLMIAESDLNDPQLVRSKAANGYGFDSQWSDDFHHSLVSVLTGDTSGYYADFGRLADLSKSLTQVFVYGGEYSGFRGRSHGRPVQNLPGWHFCGYSQNHDQVGNRAKGERLIHLTDQPRAKIAAALTLLSPFLPMLFQGEEWGASTPFQYFTDHEDEALGRLVSEGRRKEFAAFGWKPEDVPDPQAASTFEASKLKWEELRQPEHAEMLKWYRDLIALRRSKRDLTSGVLEEVDVHFDESEKWFSMRRGSILLFFTLHEEGHTAALDGDMKILLASDSQIRLEKGRLQMPHPGVAILSVA